MDKTFVFNKNNICTNPNTPISWISEGKPSMGWSFDVFTALTPKGWVCGLDCNMGDSCASCISYYSYIKPQLPNLAAMSFNVVYRTIPTSNHNPRILLSLRLCVVYRTIPTSNHNKFLHLLRVMLLYIVLFLHQTTTPEALVLLFLCCISYYSYIKPQLRG